MCFNSKRCDYEEITSHNTFLCACFNSKRCDYENFYEEVKAVWIAVSIPKGAIMSAKKLDM